MDVTLPLDDPCADLATVGGKGESLAELVRAGLPVPPGFHVTTAAYRAFVQESGIEPTADDVKAQFTAHPLPESIAAPIRDAYAALGEPAVAVRSSATAEDLPDASFAGQQDTFLDVRGADAVLDAVRRCWASLWNDRAVAYRAGHGIDGDVALAVVVQEMVAADAAGVLFTADPVSGADDAMVVDAVRGLGEALVSGDVTPDHLVVDAATGAVRERRTRDEPVLDDAAVAELIGLGRRIVAHYGRPMDVEWARAGGRFAIVQARPITTIRDDPWNDSRGVDHLWTNTNLGEAVPDVVTPLTWSLLLVFMGQAMTTASVEGLRGYGRVGGRFYMDLSVSAAPALAMGISEKRFRSLVRSTFGTLPDGVTIPAPALPRLTVLRRVLPVGVRTIRGVRPLMRRLPGIVATNPDRCAGLVERIGRADAPALARLWDDELRPLLELVSGMLSAAGRSDPVALLTAQRTLAKLVGEADATAMTSGLTVDGDVLASLGPIVGLARVERGEIDEAEWARAYGHRGPHEFEVSMPSPGEQPGWVGEQIAALRRAGSDPLRLLEQQEAANHAAWDRLAATRPRRVARTRAQVARWARAERAREQVRSEVIRVFHVLRVLALRAGELTGLGDDVFLLEIDELTAVLRGGAAPDVAPRRAAYDRYRALPPYPSVIRGPFDPFAWAADPHRRTDVVDATAAPAAAPEGAVTGFPGAAGVVEGTVRVLTSVDDGGRLEPGEVLVTTVTNIGWTPLFPRVAAVVTDVGAPLSHAAIVARELGVPAVVGCGDATSRLHTGDRVRVDGTLGTVEILGSDESVAAARS
jgi:rifampicin phosphotransferase